MRSDGVLRGSAEADLFSARTFLPHWEQVYMLSPSSVSLMVTSSRDSWTRNKEQSQSCPAGRRPKRIKETTHIDVLHVGHLTPDGVELLGCLADVVTVLQEQRNM